MNEEHTVDTLRQRWLKEQHLIASQVRVLKDDLSSVIAENEDLYLLAFPSSDEEAQTKQVYYGGVDVSFPKNESDPSVAVYVIVEQATMKVVYQDHEYFHLTAPYIPSFLASREIEPLCRLIEKQRNQNSSLTPCCILVDGNGVLHPRGAGIACFLGVRTRIPTIGIGKTLFCQGGITKDFVWQKMDESLARNLASLQKTAATSNLSRTSNQTIAFDKHCIRKSKDEGPDDKAEQNTEHAKLRRGPSIRELAHYCCGLAIPLEASITDVGGDGMPFASFCKSRILACVLVGHGGQVRGRPSLSSHDGGTKVPIFVSVGHDISLVEAVTITASLSIARIPEPVRQADLIGRELLRKQGAGHSHSV